MIFSIIYFSYCYFVNLQFSVVFINMPTEFALKKGGNITVKSFIIESECVNIIDQRISLKKNFFTQI